MQKASPAGFLSPPGSSPAFLTLPCNTSVAQTKRHKCKQEMNSIVFYFSINLSSWQVQQKIIKPSGGKTMCHSCVTFKRGEEKKSSSSDVGASFNACILMRGYQLRFLPLNDKKWMQAHTWWTMLMFGFPLKVLLKKAKVNSSSLSNPWRLVVGGLISRQTMFKGTQLGAKTPRVMCY